MNSKHHCSPQLGRVSAIIAAAFFHSLGAQAAESDTARNPEVRLAEIEVVAPVESASFAAPTDGRLDALQPQSSINLFTIQNTMAPSADYATIANIAPSVANIETNGPGLSEAKHTTIRGIDDGGYNVTFDGIPFGDYNTFTHHTTSYFPAKLVGQVVVDRGPGTASTIGNATFGGTMALLSKDPRNDAAFVPTLSMGSWNTRLGHFEVDSGAVGALNGGSVIASYQRMTTGGYRTNSDMTRDTYFLKYQQPLGASFRMTVLSSLNTIKFGNPGTVTQQQIDTLGRNFGLKDDNAANKLDLLNRRYNYQEKTADFEYIKLETHSGFGWKLENKAYTYSYNNQSHEKPKAGSGAAAGTMLGSLKQNEYRTYGDSLAVVHDGSLGTFKVGAWYDTTMNHRFTYGVNYDTTGADAIDLSSTALYKAAAPGGNPLTLPGASAYDYKYLLVDHNISFQPFAEFEWKAATKLRLNGGVKEIEFTRHINADVNQTSGRQALVASRTDRAFSPSFSAHYEFDANWSAFVQAARGFQAPSEANSFYVNGASLGLISIEPQISTNYQIGTVYKTDRFTADASAYSVDFKNYAYSGPTDSTGDPLYYGIAKGAYYRGFEAEATYLLGHGVSVYANGSVNGATFKSSKLDVPTVPNRTAGGGFSFSHGALFGSFAEKYIGSWVIYDTVTNPDIAGAGASRSAHSDAFWLADLSIGYNWKFQSQFFRSVKTRLQVGNLFDKKVQSLDSIGSDPTKAYTTDAFNVLPTRNYHFTISADF